MELETSSKLMEGLLSIFGPGVLGLVFFWLVRSQFVNHEKSLRNLSGNVDKYSEQQMQCRLSLQKDYVTRTESDKTVTKVDDHEKRITVLETKAE